VLVVLSGAFRRPAGPADGGPIEPYRPNAAAARPTTAPTVLRLASFNIHSGKGPDHRLDLPRIAEAVKGYDLVALQEVRGGYAWGRDQADILGDMIGSRVLFAPTETHWWGASFGNGLLTTTKVERWRRTPLPHIRGKGHRNMVHLDVPFGPGVLSVVMTHLSLIKPKQQHGSEFEVVTDLFLKLPPPAVLMGDLNKHADNPAMLRLLATAGVEDPVGQRVAHFPHRWEYILLRGVRWRDAGRVDPGASDHALIWVEVESK
jgi:endonuclease/exonuclease/phosphatase family metal-dependent hydrolase